jgi:hypothetical protein
MDNLLNHLELMEKEEDKDKANLELVLNKVK